jgi:lysophospholipase L1-like esterase
MRDLINALNAGIERIGEEMDLMVLDPYPLFSDPNDSLKPIYDYGDGAHLNVDGYRVLGEFVRDSLRPMLVPGTTIGCLGDSLTEGYPFSLRTSPGIGAGSSPFKAFPDFLRLSGVTVVNLGVAGDTTMGMLERSREVVPNSMDFCTVMGGTNDMLLGRSVMDIMKSIVNICDVLVNEVQAVPILVKVLPTRVISGHDLGFGDLPEITDVREITHMDR